MISLPDHAISCLGHWTPWKWRTSLDCLNCSAGLSFVSHMWGYSHLHFQQQNSRIIDCRDSPTKNLFFNDYLSQSIFAMSRFSRSKMQSVNFDPHKNVSRHRCWRISMKQLWMVSRKMVYQIHLRGGACQGLCVELGCRLLNYAHRQH